MRAQRLIGMAFDRVAVGALPVLESLKN